MRKALIGLMMAATVLTPIAAQAQETQDVDRDTQVQQRYERQAQRNAQRYEQRQQRQQERQVQQSEPVQQQQAQPAAVAQRERSGRGEWRRGDRQQQQQVQEQVIQEQRLERRGDWQRSQQQLPSTTGWEGGNDPRYRDEAARYDRRARENAVRYGTRQQRQEVRDWRQDRRGDRRDWRRNWSRDSWRSDRRYDWQNYRYRNGNIFRVSPYYSPYRSHRYSRFSIGIFLDSLFYDRRYWIGDPWQYRLPAAPYGTQWVRYYDDVLLVDVYSGEVIDVIYNFFW